MQHYRAQININPKALEHNLKEVKKLAPNSKIMAMIKANGYGHGLLAAAKALNQADAFGVACIEEAQILRANNVSNQIILMEGVLTANELKLAHDLNLSLVIHSLYQLQLLESHPKYNFNIWLKLNTGMNRLGLSSQELNQCLVKMKDCSNINLIGFMSHFAASELLADQNSITQEQIKEFELLIADNKGSQSLANSAAILNYPNSHLDWVRPGLMLYGVSNIKGKTGKDFNLMPAMEFVCRVIQIKTLVAGAKVGYGQTWQATQDTKIATCSIGYGDGYPWSASSKAKVYINGNLYPVVGRVSMDMLAVDLGQNTSVNIGDQVELWGSNLPIEDVASAALRIPYELLTNVKVRSSG